MAIVLDLDFASTESPNTNHEQLENKVPLMVNPSTHVFNASHCSTHVTTK